MVIWTHISSRGKLKILLLVPFMVVASFAELFSLAIFPVYLGVLISPDNITKAPGSEILDFLFNGDDPTANVKLITLLFCFSVAVSCVFRVLLLNFNTKIFINIGNELSVKVYELIINRPYRFFLNINSSEIHALMYKSNGLSSNALEPFFNSLICLVISMFIFSGLLYVDATIALSAVLILGLSYCLIIFVIRKFIEKNSHVIASRRGPLTKVIQESIGGVREVILSSSQNVYSTLYKDNLVPIQTAEGRNKVYGATPRIFIEAFGIIVLSTLAYVVHSSDQEQFSSIVPILATVALGFHKLLPLAQQIYANVLIVKGAKQSIQDCVDALQLEAVSSNGTASAQYPQEAVHSLELRDVSFRYPDRQQLALQNISFTVEQGKSIGFVGTSGAGKSTLLDVIMGFLEPTAGDICVNGEILHSDNLNEWFAKIAHVPQSIFLLDATITENIAFGVPESDIDWAKLNEAVSMACLSDTIDLLPEGLNTKLGERGLNLSGGQCQRVGIARALYRGAKLLVLDEATSALDHETEMKIVDNIRALQKDLIIVIVAHRLSSLKNCDEIYRISDGGLTVVSIEELIKQTV